MSSVQSQSMRHNRASFLQTRSYHLTQQTESKRRIAVTMRGLKSLITMQIKRISKQI